MNRPLNTASFPVRRMDFRFDGLKRYWFGNDAGMTHYLTALSTLFPAGERFFVDSVRALRHHTRVKNSTTLQADISAFIGQEAMHSKEHHALNLYAQEQGLNSVIFMEEVTQKIINLKRFFKFIAPQEMIDLSATCALEHFTAVLAEQLLTRTDFQKLLEQGDPLMYKMWMWHAIEETEHKAVAFDMYTAIYGRGAHSYFVRMVAMFFASMLLAITQTWFTAKLMREDGKLAPKHWIKQVAFFYGPKGAITQIIPELLQYARFNFHPNDHDVSAYVEVQKKKLQLL